MKQWTDKLILTGLWQYPLNVKGIGWLIQRDTQNSPMTDRI